MREKTYMYNEFLLKARLYNIVDINISYNDTFRKHYWQASFGIKLNLVDTERLKKIIL